MPCDHPLAASAWTAELRAGLRRLWERRAALLDLAEALPQTLCHLDVWPMNLIARGGPGDEIVLLDWAFVGGWRGDDAEVRRAIAVTGAAKYCWLAPIMLQRLADGGQRFYDRRAPEEVLRGRAGMLGLVADWRAAALAGVPS